MPSASAARRAAEMRRTPVDAHLTAAECLVTGEDLHQRRFAGAVLAEQAVDAPGFERKAHAMQHAHRPERLDDLVELNGDTHRALCSFGAVGGKKSLLPLRLALEDVYRRMPARGQAKRGMKRSMGPGNQFFTTEDTGDTGMKIRNAEPAPRPFSRPALARLKRKANSLCCFHGCDPS